MANAFDPGAEPEAEAGGSPPPPPGGGGGPPGGPPSPSGGPPGGGPILAMLGRQQMGPPVTAPGPGNMAQGMMMLTQAHGLLTQALQMFPAGSPQWKDVHKSLGSLGRHMSQGAPETGAQQTNLMDLLRNVAKNALLQRIMQQRGGSPGGGGNEPGPGAPGVPSPATPLPGA
jgi:hypothetical protein